MVAIVPGRRDRHTLFATAPASVSVLHVGGPLEHGTHGVGEVAGGGRGEPGWGGLNMYALLTQLGVIPAPPA
jgi:hypothetical protein